MMKSISILLVLFIFSGCSKQKCATKSQCAAPSDEGLYKAMQGEWNWVQTVCCGRGAQTTTPESEKYKKTLKVISETELEFQKNGQSEGIKKYAVSRDKMEGRLTIEIDGRLALLKIKCDTMVIDYGYMDLQTDTYVKKRK